MNFKKVAMLATLTAAAGLGGCATHVSRDISASGTPEEVIFPSVDRIVLQDGTFPTIEALRQVGNGITKDQLYQLLGRPHFNEGFGRVREWDYLFHFREGDAVRTCQFKVIFDKEYRGQNFYWLPADCDKVIEGANPPASAPDEPAETEQHFNVSGDALFKFGRSGLGDMLPGGEEKLEEIAREVINSRAVRIEVIGHTDRLGSVESNDVLSKSRADTVRTYLIRQGVRAQAITARGAGASDPQVACSNERARPELIQCLQPNRRVEIIASGKY